MSSVPEQSVAERLRAFEGALSGPPLRAPDEVNAAMIRHWCEAMGDRNPVYTDAGAAARSVHGGIVAPPTMLQAWTMRGLGGQARAPEEAMARVLRLLDEAGFTSVVATNCEQEYARYLRPGDRITATSVIESISGEKRTALGTGHFVTEMITFTDQRGEVVGTQRFRLLKYRAEQPAAAAAPGKRARPAMNQDTEFFWRGVARGELLIQRCAACGVLRHPPRPMCARCRSLEWDTVRASGRGEVYSFVVAHHPPPPGFHPPYVVALVRLDEGVRLVSNLVGVAPGDARIGMPVEVVFEAVDGDLVLPLFRPRTAGE